MSLNLCSKCVTPETHESIVFDAKGVCNICRQIEYKQEKIDWSAKKIDLDQIMEKYKGKGQYDCLVPFSGGKDSTWTLLYLMKEYKIKPLVVQFNHGFLRPNILENNQRTFRKLGVDVQTFTPNWKVVQRTMLETLIRKGDFCWHCHTGIFAYPMQVALMTKTPLVIWGEPSAEYTSYYSYEEEEAVDEKRFNRYINLGITAEDMVGMLGKDVELRDLAPFQYPKELDLRKLGYRSICLGSYIPWDVKKQVSIIKEELGWKGDQVEGVPPGYDYEKIECWMQGVRDYIKFLKRGYSRVSHLTSIDIRNGRMTRDEALKLVKEYEGKVPASLPLFLGYVGITEEQFYQIVLKTVVAPHQPLIEDLEHSKPLQDYHHWYKENKTNDCHP